MPSEESLELGLEFITEGRQATAPRRTLQAVMPQAFTTRGLMVGESLMAEAESVREQARDWTSGSGVQGLGIGDKIRDGKSEGELALRVYVEKKKPPPQVKNLVPKEVDIPEIGPLPTDVIEIGKVETETFTIRARPAMPGCGIGHAKVTVGTFGCLARKKGEAGGLYILSNSHVLANEGLAQIGDGIVQPGKYDGGVAKTDTIGTLAEFVPFEFTQSGYPNLVDAAIAKVGRKTSVTPQMRILGTAPVGIGRTLRRGMRVKKVGRTTDYTTGEIIDIHFRVETKYLKPGNKLPSRVGFKDQVLCTRYTGPGDSGSVVLNSRDRVVGLHFAGSPSASIFNRIEHVLELLDIELVTEGTA